MIAGWATKQGSIDRCAYPTSNLSHTITESHEHMSNSSHNIHE
jgi:hypothetical protein